MTVSTAIQPIECDGRFWVEVVIDGHETNRYGPYANIGAAEAVAPLFNVYPAVGFPLTIKAFAITILGGMGNPAGALVASFVVSIAESLSVMVIPSQWQNLIAFAVMIVMLLVRPRGLFGRAVSR